MKLKMKFTEEVFIDSSIFIAHCMKNDRTLLKLVERKNKLVTSPSVLEEALYKCLFIKNEETFGGGVYSLKRNYQRHRDVFSGILLYFEKFIKILREYEILRLLEINDAIYELMIEMSKKYSLLPNDALIAATCKFYGIKHIASFDEDFQRVDFLEVLRA